MAKDCRLPPHRALRDRWRREPAGAFEILTGLRGDWDFTGPVYVWPENDADLQAAFQGCRERVRLSGL